MIKELLKLAKDLENINFDDVSEKIYFEILKNLPVPENWKYVDKEIREEELNEEDN